MINPTIIALDDLDISILKQNLAELRELHDRMGIESQGKSSLEDLIDSLPGGN